MSKSSELDKTVKAYILDCIENPDDDTLDDAGKMAWVRKYFDDVANYPHNIKRLPSEQARLADWLAGLPSGVDIAFTNHEIICLAEKWGSLAPNANDTAQQKILDNYFPFMAAKMLQLFKKYGV